MGIRVLAEVEHTCDSGREVGVGEGDGQVDIGLVEPLGCRRGPQLRTRRGG